MPRKNKQRSKNKKKKIIITLVVLICVLIICAAWCYHNKLNKQSTITVNELSDNFMYLSQESYTENIDHVFSFKYDLKEDYKMYINYYKDNKKVSSGLLFIPLSKKGTFYIKFRQVENEIKFDFFNIGEYIDHCTPYSYTPINDISGFTYGSFNEIDSDFTPHDKEKKKIILNSDKKQFIFKLEPFIYLDKDISSSAEANDKNRIEIFIKK